jgi:uronate dehydrogenase
MERVLITGAAGDIGGRLRRSLQSVYPKLRLSDVRDLGQAAEGEEIMAADVADMDAMQRLCEGVDGVVHLGGMAVENRWEVILSANLIGCYNLFEAARRQGVKRVVFASSNHAVGFYRRDRSIDHRVPVKPDSRYGVSKAFGEALGSLYADKYGLGVFCIRIGNVADRPADKRRLSIWISPRDLTQLVRIGLEHPDLHCEIVYGVSDNQRSWYDNSNAFRLGYRPEDKAEDHAEEVLAREPPHPPGDLSELYQGGTFVAAEIGGDPNKAEPA